MRKPSNLVYVQITTTKGERKFRRYRPKKYERKKETLPDGWAITSLKKDHWKARRKHFQKKWWPRFLRWVRKHRIELTIFILFLGAIATVIALFIKD